MDIEVNNKKQQANFRNGKFYHTFTPTTANQKIKLYHMGCVGDTRLNRIQLEQGTEPTGFVAPKQTTNTLSGIFKNLRDIDVQMKDPTSDLWSKIKKTARGTIEEYHTSTLSNEIVKTAEGIVERQTSIVDRKITAETKRYSDELSSRITTLSNDTLRKDEVKITPNGVTIGSGKIIDGRTITSLITTQPENIKAITDRFVITPANENLVTTEYRESAISSVRDIWITPEITSDKLNNGDQFIIEGIGTWSGTLRHDLNFIIAVKYKSGSWTWISSRLKARGEYSNSIIPLKATLTINGLNDEVVIYKLGLQQPDWSNFTNITFKNTKIYKKKSAELIVDGTIEGKHIKSSTIETGHLKAGSVTADIIASNAIESKHMKVDDAMIDKLVGNKAFVSKLWARDAFINNLESVKIKSTQIDTESLRGKTISGGIIDGGVIKGDVSIKLGEHGFLQPIEQGLQINAPKSYDATSGVGFQLRGYKQKLSNGNFVPKGVFIYNDDNFFAGGASYDSVDDILLTVNGKVSMCNNFKGSVVSGAPIISNFSANTPVRPDEGIMYRISFIGWDGRSGSLYINDGSDKNGSWWFRPDASVSDKRLKENIKETTDKGLDLVNKLKFYSFDWKPDKFGYKKPHTKIGQLAQDLQRLDESLVYSKGDMLAIDDFRLLNISLKAIQELSTENKELKQRIIKLEEKVNG